MDPLSQTREYQKALETSVACLMINYDKEPNGNERLDWKVIGKPPSLTTVGALTRVQFELVTYPSKLCDPVQLVMVWDGTAYSWFVHPSIPKDVLIGMMEKVKLQILGTLMAHDATTAHKAPPKNRIIGLDGRPIM